jgi:hypothetical protein
MACLQAAFLAGVNGEGVGLATEKVGVDASLATGSLLAPVAASGVLPSVLQPETKTTTIPIGTSQRVIGR